MNPVPRLDGSKSLPVSLLFKFESGLFSINAENKGFINGSEKEIDGFVEFGGGICGDILVCINSGRFQRSGLSDGSLHKRLSATSLTPNSVIGR